MEKVSLKKISAGALFTLIAISGTAANAQENRYSGEIFERIKSTGQFVVGHRTDVVPFSFVNEAGQPDGYTIDICKNIYENLKVALKMPNLAIKYKAISSKERISAAQKGEIDMECGLTTVTQKRLEEVDFSYAVFVGGTRFMVKKNSNIKDIKGLDKKQVAIGSATNTVNIVNKYKEQRVIDFKIVPTPTVQKAFEEMADGKVDAVASDDAGLWGLSQKTSSPADFELIGAYISQEPYGLLYKKGNPDFAKFVDTILATYFRNKDIVKTYDKWFVKGQNVKKPFPMSYVLKDALKRPSKLPASY